MSNLTLSVTVITLNEEENIRRCLDSVRFADEIVIVDSGSKDTTCQVAREYTGKVFFHSMQGFGLQKQFAVERASGDWILSLDADEWLSDEAQQSLKTLLRGSSREVQFNGYSIYRRNLFLGRPMRYCGWYVPILRLFRRGYGRFNEKLVHEELVVNGPVGLLKGDIIHAPYKDLLHHLDKMKHYALLDARELINRKRKVHGWHGPMNLLLRPFLKFIEKYVIQQGYREGLHGLVLSSMAAIGVFLIHAQCWDLQRMGKDSKKETDV